MGAVDVNALRVVVFLISEYACDGRFGMTWGKRTSIDADAKSSREGYIQQKGERGGEQRSGLGCAASFNYQHQNSSFEEGLSYGLTVVYGVNGLVIVQRFGLFSVDFFLFSVKFRCIYGIGLRAITKRSAL